jgi:hypothetical protein
MKKKSHLFKARNKEISEEMLDSFAKAYPVQDDLEVTEE